ncbi:hypothetical protein L7F22_028155 [Adiantum nelumboides]|nr:hypothetical protein [Adiantum nelumboides]
MVQLYLDLFGISVEKEVYVHNVKDKEKPKATKKLAIVDVRSMLGEDLSEQENKEYDIMFAKFSRLFSTTKYTELQGAKGVEQRIILKEGATPKVHKLRRLGALHEKVLREKVAKILKKIMGRNSKKNKGRKPASEQGLKGAASVATSSANIATAPARPARTAKHKVRKFPSQATTVTSTQANDSRSARGLKEIQPLLAPPNSVEHETLPSGPAATPTLESHRTCAATITEPAATISSSNEKEITVHQPDLSDSYNSLSASSSETETCMPEDTEQHSNTDSVLEIQKTKQLVTMHQTQVVSVLQQRDDHPKEQEEYTHTLLVATENEEVLQIADSSEHTSGLLAVPSVASSSPSFHNQLEAKISELSLENASRAQADEEIISLQEGVKEKNNSPLQPFHPDTNDGVCGVLSSLIKTENAESGVSEQSRSGSQTSLLHALVTSSIPPDNLQQIYDRVQELESVLESFDKGLEVDKDHTPAEKKYDTGNFIEEIESTRNFVAHQQLLSAAAHNVEQESLEKNYLTENKKEEHRQVNLCIEEAPMCSVEHSIEEVEEDRAKEATVVEEEKELDEEPSTTDNERKCGKNKPDLDVPKLESPTLEENQCQKGVPDPVDSGYVYREETNPAGNGQKKELETDDAALYEEESPEEMSDQLNKHADCEGHVANSVNSEKNKLEEQEPEVKVVRLHKEDFLQEKRDNNHGTSVCHSVFLGQIIIQAPENGTEKLDVGEPPEGDVTFHEDQTWKDGEQDQQLDGALKGHIKSIERQIKGLEIGQPEVKGQSLDKPECLQGKSDHGHFGPVSQEDETTEAVKNTMSKFDVGEPLAGAVEVEGGQEEKSDQQLDGGNRCEERATNSIKHAMEQESEADLQKVNKEECEDEKTDQTHIGFVYKEHKTGGLEKVENFNAQGDVKLNQACQEEKPDHDDSDTACQEHNGSSQNEMEKLEEQDLGNDTEIEEEKECQKRHSTRSAQEQMEQALQEVETGTLEEKKDRIEKTPIHVHGGTMDEEHCTLSTENRVEKPGMGEPDSKDITLHNKTENLEDQNARGIASEENAEPSVNIEVGNVKVEALEVTVDKEGCQEEKNNEADVGSACEEQKTQLLEDALKKPDLEEPQEGVMLEKYQKLGAEPSVQVDSEPECQEHPTSSMENPIKKLEVAELEKADDKKECEEKHSTTIFLQNETEQAKLEVKTVKTEKNKESPETMPYQTGTGPVFEGQEMHTVNDMLKQPDVETPEVTVTKDECKEEKLCQIPNLCEEHQQINREQMKEKPVTVEPHIEGLILDKDLNLQEDKLDQVHSDSRSQEHPTSYSAENENAHPKHYSTENENEQPTDYSPENENEVRELEIAIALEGEKQHTNKSVENDMEQPKPQVEIVTPEEKNASPSEKNNQIDCGRVGEEHSLENELEKAEVGEADKEIMELHKEKDSQEDKAGQLEEGTLWKKDANESIEFETEELAVEKPKPSSTNKEELEEVKNRQDQKNALETANQEETRAGALGKEEDKEEKHQQDDTGYVYEDNTELGLCEDTLETSNLEEPQVNDFILDKEERDFQEQHTTISVDHEVEQPEPEQEVVLQEKKEGPEGKPEQIDHGCVCEEYKLRSPENKDKLEKNELGEQEVERSAIQGKTECQEQNFKQLEKSFVCEGDAKNSIKSELEMLEARKPEVKSTKLQEECGARKDDQAEGGCVCEEHQAADFLEHAMEKHELGEPQIEGGTFGETQEPPEEKSDLVRTNTVYQEHPSNSVLRSLDIGESQTAIAGPEEEHTIFSIETGIQQPNPEVRSTPIEEKEESVDQMPDQIENHNMHKDCKMPSVENELENDKMGEPEVESVALKQNQESQEDQLEQLARGPTGEVRTENSVKNEAKKSETSSNTLDKEESNEVRSTPTEEKEESIDEQMPDQIEDHNMHDDRKMSSVENELENDKMEEPEVESVALQQNQESQEDQLEQLARGPIGEVHTENSVKNEARKSEISSNTLDKEESNEVRSTPTEEKEESVDEQMPDLIEDHNIHEYRKMPSVENELENDKMEEPEAESVALQQNEEIQEDQLEQLDRGPTGEVHTENSVKNEARKSEISSNTLDKEESNEVRSTPTEEKEESVDEQMPDLIEDHNIHKDRKMPSVENELENDKMEEPEVESVALQQNQESQEDQLEQLARGPTGEVHTENSVKNETRKSEISSNTLDKEESNEVQSTPTEEKEESVDEQMPDLIEDHNIHEDRKMPSVENELKNDKMEEPEVESVALQQNEESQDDQLEQLARGPTGEVHTENSVKNEAKKSQINSNTIDKEESNEGKNDQAGNGSACEKQHRTQFLEHAGEKPDVEEAQGGEGAALDNEQELPEKNFVQTDNGCVCKDETERAFENKKETIKGEPDTAMAVDKGKGYQEEHPCQLNVCDQHSMSPDEDKKEKPAVKEQEIAPLDEAQEYQEEANDQVERDYVCSEHNTKFLDISEMEGSELKDLVVHHRNESKEGEANEVSSSSPNEEPIIESEQKDLERLEVDKRQVGLALEEKEDLQANLGDHPSSVCGEQTPKSVARELEKVELEEPEQGVAGGDEMECQDVTLNQNNESKEGEADKISGSSQIEQHTPDSEKNMERTEMGEANVDLALQEMVKCQPDYTNIACEKGAQNPVVNEVRLVELEEPEAGAVTLQKVKHQEEEPGKVHSSSTYKQQTTLLERELEKQMEEPKVDHVNLDKHQLSQEENPSSRENCCQDTTSLLEGEGERETFVSEKPERSAAGLESMDYKYESYQLHKESATEEHNINSPKIEVETLEMREPEGSVKLDGENESPEETPAEAKKVPQGQEQTANSLKLEVEDPVVTFEEDKESKDDKPSQPDTDSTCEEQEMGEKTNQTDQLKKEPEACGVMHAKIQGCPRDESTQIGSHSECGQHPAVSKEHRMETLELSDQQEECAENEECQENSARLSTECVCESSEKENLDSKNLEVDIVQLNNKESQEKEPHKACDSSEGEQYTARSIENIEKIEVEQSMFEKAAHSIVFNEQGADFAENKIELAMPEVEPVQLEKTEDHNENPDQNMDEFVSEKDLTDLVKHDMEKLQVRQTELGGHVALDEKKQFQEEITNAVANGFTCETEKPEEEDAGAAENEECHAGQNHEQNDANSCVSEAQTVDSAETEGEKHEMQVPKGENSLDKMGYQNEEPDLADSDSTSEKRATNSDKNTTEFEMDQPKVEKPDMNSFSRTAGEEHRVENETEKAEGEEHRVENETEKAEMRVPNVEDTVHDQAESSSIREEHATDSKEDDMDKLEVNPPEVGMPLEVTNRSLSTEHVADSLERQVDGPEVEGSLVDLKESDSDRPKSVECSSVCGEPITEIVDRYDELGVTQPKVENHEEVIVSTSSVNEAHKLDCQKDERERSEVGVLKVEDDVLDEKESQNEKPKQDESRSVCEENASDFPDYKEGKLEMNQPNSNKVSAKSKSVYEAHMLDPHENETKKAEEALEVGNIALEPKECLGNKAHLDESSSVCEVYAADSKEEDGDEIEVNLPGEEKCDHNIAGASVLEGPAKHFLTNEMKKPDEGVPEVEDNVPEQRKCCLNREHEQHKSGSIHEEHATGFKSNDIDKPEVREPDECIPVRSVSESDELDSLETGIEKPDGVPDMKDNMQKQKECLGKTPAQDESSSVLGKHAIDTEKVDMEKPEEGVPKVEYEVLKQNECFGEKPERDDSIYVLEEHTTESKAGGRDELDVEQSKVEEPQQFRANSTAESKTHTPGILMVETKKPQEEVLHIEDNVRHKTEQDKNSSRCEEHEADPKEEDMDKLEINQSEVGEESHRVIVKSPSVIETYKLDFQKTKTHKNEQSPEAKQNVPGETVGEKPHQAAIKSVGGEHATDSKEDETDNHSNQHEVLLEKECLDEKYDQDETTVSKKDDGVKLEVHLPELYQVITRDASSENTLISMTNETEECEVRVPEVKDDGLSEENVQPVELSDLPAEDREEKQVEQGPGKNKNAYNQLHDPSSQEEEWHMEVKDSPALSKCKTEEIENRQITKISHAPGPQEGTQKHLEQLDAVKPEEAKQEPMHHSKSCEEDQKVHQIESSSLGQGTQMHDCREGNAAMPLKSISTTQEDDNLNLTTDDQEVEAGELRTHTDAKERFLDINELEDEERKQHTPQSVFQQESPAGNENAYNTHKISATRYHSDNAALSCERDVNTTLAADQTSSSEQQSGQGQKTLAGIDDIKDDFQTVNETSAAPKMQEGNFDLEETVPICIPQNMNAANLETKTEPLQENHVKQQHEEQKPRTLDVKAEDATDRELTCNLSIPILSSEEVIQQVFQSVPIPVMTCSSPGNLLPLPL